MEHISYTIKLHEIRSDERKIGWPASVALTGMANVPHALAGFRLQLVTPSLNRPGQQHQGTTSKRPKKEQQTADGHAGPAVNEGLDTRVIWNHCSLQIDMRGGGCGSKFHPLAPELEIKRSFEILKHPTCGLTYQVLTRTHGSNVACSNG